MVTVGMTHPLPALGKKYSLIEAGGYHAAYPTVGFFGGK